MTTAEELLTEDGGVRVPQALAASVHTAVLLHLAARSRAGGGALTPDARALLRALHQAAAGATGTPTSSQGSHVDASEILGAHEVADLLGCSRRWATALLGSGRIRSRQAGRTWVTTRGDLDAYRYGREEGAHEEDHPAERNPSGRR